MTRLLNNVTNGFSFTDLMVFRRRWWQHIIFWSVVLFILLNIFKTSGSFEKIDLIYTVIFLIPLISIAYLNLYHFIPRYLRHEKYLLYIMLFIISLISGAIFLYFLFDSWIDLILKNYYFISYYSIPQLMLYTGSILLLTTLLKLSRSWFMLLRIERLNTSHQLKSLHSQINPHFLLNSMQTIYALSLEKSVRTPEVILQLAEILKYTLYETEQTSVKLEKEISMIKDYVDMYRHRVDPIRADIKLILEGEPEDQYIAPMLMIPFIENSFKHGLQSGPGAAYVEILLKVKPGMLEFNVENSLGKSEVTDLDKRKGIGIKNTRQRLELLYPGRHTLNIQSEQRLYRVNLQIKLEE